MRNVRKIFVGIIGGTVLLLGFVMILLPGPAILVIPAGLAILATEFAWAARWLQKARAKMHEVKTRRAAKKAARQAPASR